MATKKTEVIEIQPIEEVKFNIRIVGDTPLIMHKWTSKARRQLLENMQGGNLTEEILLEAIKLEVPDAEPRKYEQNNCLRVDRKTQNGTRCRTDLYLIAKQSFHHVIIEYPAEEQETYGTYIEYMINTMETKESEQG